MPFKLPGVFGPVQPLTLFSCSSIGSCGLESRDTVGGLGWELGRGEG